MPILSSLGGGSVKGFAPAPLAQTSQPFGKYLLIHNSSSSQLEMYLLSTPGDLSTVAASPSSTLSISGVGTILDVTMSADGVYVYAVEATTDAVWGWQLTVPFDLSTATSMGSVSLVSYVNPYSVTIAEDGSALHTTSNTEDKLQTHTLPTAFLLSGMSGTPASQFDYRALDTALTGRQGHTFGRGGLELYVADTNSGFISWFTLSSAYNTGSVTWNGRYDITNIETTPETIQFSDDGLVLYIGSGSDISALDLTTAWDMSTRDTTGNLAATQKYSFGAGDGFHLSHAMGTASSGGSSGGSSGLLLDLGFSGGTTTVSAPTDARAFCFERDTTFGYTGYAWWLGSSSGDFGVSEIGRYQWDTLTSTWTYTGTSIAHGITTNVLGMADNGTTIAICNSDGQVSLISKSSGTANSLGSLTSDNLQGALWDGTNFWFGSFTSTNAAFRLNASNTLTKFSSLNASKGANRGAFYDNQSGYYWFSDTSSAYGHTFNGTQFTSVTSINSASFTSQEIDMLREPSGDRWLVAHNSTSLDRITQL